MSSANTELFKGVMVNTVQFCSWVFCAPSGVRRKKTDSQRKLWFSNTEDQWRV